MTAETAIWLLSMALFFVVPFAGFSFYGACVWMKRCEKAEKDAERWKAAAETADAIAADVLELMEGRNA